MPPTPIPAPTTPYAPPPPPPGRRNHYDDGDDGDEEQLPDAPPHPQDQDEDDDDSPGAASTATNNTVGTSATTNTDSSDDTPDTDDSNFDCKSNSKTPPALTTTTTEVILPCVSVSTANITSTSTATSATTPKSVDASAGLTTPSTRSTTGTGFTSQHGSSRSSNSHYSPHVVYGPGAVTRLPTELSRLNLVSPLIVSSPSRISLARRIQALISNLDSRILDSALINVPQHVVDDSVSRITGRDCVISVGGTSAVGLASAIAGRKEIPHICIPTTYSGSEQPSMDQTRRLEKMELRRRRSESTTSTTSTTAASPGGLGSTTSRSSKSPSSSRSPGGSTQERQERSVNPRPSIIIYDEDLTAAESHSYFPVPHESRTPVVLRHGIPEEQENAQWSYIHLPGV